MQLIVTRPREQAQAAVSDLRARGVEAVALPLIAIEALANAASPASAGSAGSADSAESAAGAADASSAAALQRSWATLAGRRLVMFVSANAVEHFFAAAPAGAAWPAQTLAGSTGPGTTAALLAAGVPAHCVRDPGPNAPRLDSEALWQQLRGLDWRGASVLIVRGEGGRDWLAETLRAVGAHAEFVAAYRRALPVLAAEEATLLAAAEARPDAFAWHFSSSEAVHNLPALAPGRGWRHSRALATHERIGEAARSIGFAQVQVLAPGIEMLVQAWRAASGSVHSDDGSGGPAANGSAGPNGQPNEGAPIQSRPL